jgi:fibronectin type 3 domain-containing protein/TolB-like protein
MRFYRAFLLSTGIASAFYLAGCATDNLESYFKNVDPKTNVYVAPTGSPVEKVAIMPFKAPTELIGTSVSDMFVTELLHMNRFHLVERSQMANVLGESELALAGLSESKAAEVGNMLGADAVLVGTVDEYNTIARRGNAIPVVGVSVRMIDCKSGRVLCSVDLAKRADNSDVTLPEQARIVVHSMAAGLYQKWKCIKASPLRAPVSASPSPLSSPVLPAPAPSAAVSSPAPRLIPPPPPSGFKVSDMGLRQTTISWNAPADATASRYRIERADNRNGTFISIAEVAPSRRTFIDKGATLPLKDSSTYYYRMAAIAESGLQSDYTVIHETMTAPPPSPVAGLTAESEWIRIVPLNWTASTDPGIVRYVILRAESDGGPFNEVESVRGPATTSFTDGGREPGKLKDGKTYHYRIRAVNEVGAISDDIPAVAATTRSPPPMVSGLKAEDARPREVPLSWNASSDEKVDRYVISRAEGANGSFSEIETLRDRNRTTWLDRGGVRNAADLGNLKDGTLYRYQITAINLGDTRSSPGQEVTVTTKPAPRPPAGLSAGRGIARKIRLQWNSNTEPDIRKYIVEGRETGAWRFHEIARVDSSGDMTVETTQEGLADGKTYEYHLKALDGDRLESEWTTPVQGATKPAPHPPTGMKVTWIDNQALLSWNAPPQPDIKQYRVWKKGVLGLGAAPLGNTDGTEFALHATNVGAKLNVQISSIDVDGLESQRSEPLEIRR